jgi:hypothetical protein
MRLDVAMHDSLRMTIIEGLKSTQFKWMYLEQFIDVVAIIVVGEFRIQCAKVGIIDVFKDQTWGLTLSVKSGIAKGYLIISHDI